MRRDWHSPRPGPSPGIDARQLRRPYVCSAGSWSTLNLETRFETDTAKSSVQVPSCALRKPFGILYQLDNQAVLHRESVRDWSAGLVFSAFGTTSPPSFPRDAVEDSYGFCLDPACIASDSCPL